MAGGTLLVSREVENHSHFKKRFEDFGFPDVTPIALDKDALYSHLRKTQPDKLVMSARYYYGCTPFVMGQLHNEFPGIKMAAVCLGEYPADIAMYFILNGITSYLNSSEGFDQFYKGLGVVAKGGEYVSPAVNERIKLRFIHGKPKPAGKISDRHLQVIRLICSGFKDWEIAEVLALSRNTIVNHKTDVFTSLNVRSPIELVRAALILEIIRLEELFFYPRDMIVNPIPDAMVKGRARE